MKPLLIRASAGTGKTYRLSLEFINLLLKYRIDFEEILVITFTRKATAEIRERIFEHLHNIVHNTNEGKEISNPVISQDWDNKAKGKEVGSFIGMCRLLGKISKETKIQLDDGFSILK